MFNRNEFKAMLVEKGITYQVLAKTLHIDKSTLVRRLNHNGNLTVNQLEKMFDLFGRERVINIFFRG